jgi:serine/threonine-protein kinase OSR1/STK39
VNDTFSCQFSVLTQLVAMASNAADNAKEGQASLDSVDMPSGESLPPSLPASRGSSLQSTPPISRGSSTEEKISEGGSLEKNTSMVFAPKPNSENEEWPTDESDYRYEKDDVIGEGAFAKVYKAYCIPRKKYVAIKIMSLEKVGDGIADIRNEVATMKTCSHANILTCHACFVVNSKLWMVMPLMDRGSCLHILRLLKVRGERDGLPEAWCKYILSEAMKGVAYLHDQNLLHRDLKAGNILLDSAGNVKIADFGVSGWLQDATQQRRAVRNTFVGTPCWMAPEVMEQSEGYSFPADVWSMGITAFELAKGTAPYAQHPPMKVLLKTLSDPPPNLSSYEDEKAGKPALGTEWVKRNKNFLSFTSKCLVKNPKDRSKITQLLNSKFFKNADALKDQMAKEVAEIFPKNLAAILNIKKSPAEAMVVHPVLEQRQYVEGVEFVFSDDSDDEYDQLAEAPQSEEGVTESAPGASEDDVFRAKFDAVTNLK